MKIFKSSFGSPIPPHIFLFKRRERDLKKKNFIFYIGKSFTSDYNWSIMRKIQLLSIHIFVAASHQTQLDTRSKARRPIIYPDYLNFANKEEFILILLPECFLQSTEMDKKAKMKKFNVFKTLKNTFLFGCTTGEYLFLNNLTDKNELIWFDLKHRHMYTRHFLVHFFSVLVLIYW